MKTHWWVAGDEHAAVCFQVMPSGFYRDQWPLVAIYGPGGLRAGRLRAVSLRISVHGEYGDLARPPGPERIADLWRLRQEGERAGLRIDLARRNPDEQTMAQWLREFAVAYKQLRDQGAAGPLALIAAHLGVTPATTHYHVKAAEQRGYLPRPASEAAS